MNIWKQRLGSKATYRNLKEIFGCAGYGNYADIVTTLSYNRDLKDLCCQLEEASDCLSPAEVKTLVFPDCDSQSLPFVAELVVIQKESKQGTNVY